MSRGTFFAHLFGFVVLFAMLVLPQAAQAHAGHAHAMHLTIAPTNADGPASAHADEHQNEQSLTAATQNAPNHAHDSSCDCGSCVSSSSAACFSAVAPRPPLVSPPSHGTAIGMTSNQGHPGVDTPSLRRPPRSFARTVAPAADDAHHERVAAGVLSPCEGIVPCYPVWLPQLREY